MRNTRTIYCQVQGKGGTGKSFLTYLLALKYCHDLNVLFIDADFNSKTSSSQNLVFLKPKKEVERIVFFDILDGQKNIQKKRFIKMLKRFGETDFQFETVFIDFGTLESDQFLALFIEFFQPDELKELEKEYQLKFVFQVIMAGNTNYLASMSYLKKVQQLFGELHEIIICPNLEKFNEDDGQLQQIIAYAKRFDLPCKPFGDFGNGSETENDLRAMMQQGKPIEEFPDMITQWLIEQQLQKL